jgi:ribosomal protein S18 acetylase RimI-like enzyme
LIIRTLIPADHSAALDLWRSCPGIQLRAEDGYAGLCAYLQRNPGLSLAGEVDGVLVATLLAGHDGRRGYLQHLVVAPAMRRHGYARRLLDEAARRLHEQGIGKAHVFVLRDAVDAMPFWGSQPGWQQRDDIQVYSTLSGDEGVVSVGAGSSGAWERAK